MLSRGSTTTSPVSPYASTRSPGFTATALLTLAVGVVFSGAVILLQQLWPHYHDKAAFPINGQWCFFANICLCVGTYVLVSLADKANPVVRSYRIIDGTVTEEAIETP